MVLAFNLLVAFAKLAVGLLANSLSLMADAAHSFFDSTSNILGLVGVSIAYQPPDEEQPYGHRKYETLATAGVAVLLFITSFEILKGSVERFISPVKPEITYLTLAVMVATIAVNLGVSYYERIRARTLKSQILLADSIHTRSDVYVSLSVLFGFAMVKLSYAFADPAVAVLISFFIAKSAYEIIKRSSTVLVDEMSVDVASIKKHVRSVDGIRSCHKVRARGVPENIYVDLHIQVDPDISVLDAHNISNVLEEKLKRKIPGVVDVVVHIEPGF